MRVLAKGENSLLPTDRLTVSVEAAGPVERCALLLAPGGKVAQDSDFVFYNQPSATGVTLTTSAVAVDLGAIPASVEHVVLGISVAEGQPSFGAAPAPVGRVARADGSALFEFAPSDLTDERAIVVFEFYRRAGAWKLRAVGQGYRGGLAELATAHGVVVDDPEPAGDRFLPESARDEVVSGAAGNEVASESARGAVDEPAPVAAPPGTTDPERLFRVLTGIFEDAARSAAGYRSAVTFAEQRRERELASLLEDPRSRGAAGPARSQADERYAELVTRATADHRRDVDALAGELDQLTATLPAALAPWSAAAWQHRARYAAAAGVRAGELHLPEAPDLRIPLLVSAPLRRPLWFDTSDAGNGASAASFGADPFGADPFGIDSLGADSLGADLFAADPAAARAGGAVAMARALILRLLAADRSVRLQLCDPDGALTAALGGLVTPGSAVLGAPVARTLQQRSQLLADLAQRLDLIEMARGAGALDALPGAGDRTLLVLTGVPVAFEELDLRRLRYLIDRSAPALQLVILGDPDDAGPVADILGAALRLAPGLGAGISDGWVGMAWTFTPDFGPSNPASIVFER